MMLFGGSQIRQGAIISYVSLFLNMLIGLLFTPWVIRTIGRADYGLYTLVLSVISFFVFDWGLSRAITRFVAKYYAENKHDKVIQILSIVFKIYLVIAVIVFVISVAIYYFIPDIYRGLTLEEISKFKLLFVIAAVFSVVSFPFTPLNGILSAYERFVELKLCEVLHRLIIVVLMSYCLLTNKGVLSLVMANSVAGIIQILIKLFIFKKKLRLSVNLKVWNTCEAKSLATFAGWSTIITLAQRCIFIIAPSILGVVSNSVEITLLGIAITLEAYVFLFADAINGMFLPKVSKLIADKKNDDIMPLMIKIGRVQIIIISFILLGFFSCGEDFICIWVGKDFISSYYCAILIMLPSIVQLSQEIGLTTIVARNKVKEQALIYSVMAIINLIIAFPLASVYGSVGIAVSIFIAYIIRTIGLNWIFKNIGVR